MELIPSIVREAKPSPSSKRIKLGHDVPLAMFKEEMKQAHKGHDTTAWTSDEVVERVFCVPYLLFRIDLNLL